MASSSSSVPEKKVTLVSSEGDYFEVEESAILLSQTIRHMIEDDCAKSPIPLPNVSSRILAKVIEYCKRHSEVKLEDSRSVFISQPAISRRLKKFDTDFVKVDQNTLFDLILAANYLDIKEMLDLTCQRVADVIKGKSPDDIRKILNITNDYTPEEEAEVRREFAWAFE